jgi:ATP/maltotriose-dependent transcriptional regulator MalT
VVSAALIGCDPLVFSGTDSSQSADWSKGTVRTHLENTYRLLQVSSRTA